MLIDGTFEQRIGNAGGQRVLFVNFTCKILYFLNSFMQKLLIIQILKCNFMEEMYLNLLNHSQLSQQKFIAMKIDKKK